MINYTLGSDIHSQHGSNSSAMTPRQRREYLIAVRKGNIMVYEL